MPSSGQCTHAERAREGVKGRAAPGDTPGDTCACRHAGISLGGRVTAATDQARSGSSVDRSPREQRRRLRVRRRQVGYENTLRLLAQLLDQGSVDEVSPAAASAGIATSSNTG
jgi:hypothetical protein